MFISFRQIRLQARLFTVLMGLSVFAYFLLAILLYYDQYNRLTREANHTMERHNVDIHLLLDFYFNERTAKISRDLQTFQSALDKRGGVAVKEKIFTVRANSEQTHAIFPITLSEWQAAGKRIDKDSLFVDSLAKHLGCELSIFQKVPQGMLCVSTTLKSSLSERRIYSYMPNEWNIVQVCNEGKTFQGRVMLNKVWYLVAYMPIKQDNRVIGMLGVCLPEQDFSYLERTLTKKRYLESGHLYFFDSEGKIILHHDGSNYRSKITKIDPNLLQKALRRKNGYYDASFGGDRRWQYFSYYKRADFYTAITISEGEIIDKPLKELRNLLLGLFMVFFGLSSVVAYAFSNFFTRPLVLIARALGNFAAGKKTRPLALKRKDEMGNIAHALNQIIHTSERYALFAKAIGEGRFNQPFASAGAEDILGNALLQMRLDLQQTAEEETIRNWVTVQNAHFSEIIRKNQDDRERLAQVVLGSIMQRLNMVQGAFYHVGKDGGEEYLQMVSAYAYQRPKLLQERFSAADGLLGEAYQNKRVVEVRDLPEGYLKLLAGVGEASPNYLIIIPCQTNVEVLGLLELASFEPIEPFKVEFLKELTNTIGSTLANIRTAELTIKYLRDAQEAAEQLRQQDEELRQNMEELSTTNEQITRQDREIKELLDRSTAHEQSLKVQVLELMQQCADWKLKCDNYERQLNKIT